MRVALTGISGFIGARIATTLVEHGHSVVGLVRPTSRRDHVEHLVERFVVGDQRDRGCFDELLEGADGVIHNSFDWGLLRAGDLPPHLDSNLNASLELLARSAPRAFVYLSSIAVHHDMRPRWEGLIDEDHPLRPAGLYGACKASVEAHLWAAHASSTGPDDAPRHVAAVRPSAVYGIDPKLDRSIGHPIVQQLRETGAYDRPGGGKFVHVDDVAELCVRALTRPEASGRAFNMADCYARWGDWARIAAEIMGIPASVDLSSPASPQNAFTKDASASLGVPMDRGLSGIEAHLRELIGLFGAPGA